MPDDPRKDNLTDVIFDYEALPTSSPLTHPIIRGGTDPVAERNQPDKYFERPDELRIGTTGLVINNILSSANGVSVRWKYPIFPTSVYHDLGIEIGVNPLTPASVAYELRVLEGTFSEDDVNNPRTFGTSGSSQQSLQQAFPGTIVYEKFANLSRPAEPIWLTKPASGQVDLPDGILENGKNYTAILRHLFWTQAFDPDETRFEHYLSQYSLATFSINETPTVGNPRANGKKSATISSQDKIALSFAVSDRDGPRTMYKVNVITEDTGFYFTSGWIAHYETASANIEIEYQLPLSGLQAGIRYYWGVDLQDGLCTVVAGEPLDYFTINSAPDITSLKANGNELLYGNEPRIGNEDVEISWEFNDDESGDQEAYVLVLSSGGEEFLNTGIVRSNASSVVIPELPDGKTIIVSLKVKDSVEFGTEATGRVLTNSSPRIVGLLVDGKPNPRDVLTATPVISWTFVDNNKEDTQSAFRIQVANDDALSNLAWDTGEVAGASFSVTYGSTGSPIVVPEVLVHGILYHFRVSVSDGISWSDYSVGFFAVNRAPGNPLLVSPSAGSYSGTVNVQWTAVTDPDGDEVTYVVEITNQRAFDSGWELLAGPLDSSITSYEMDVSRIPAGTNYGVRVIAGDGFAESDPRIGGTSPRFEISNHAPNTPIVTSPSESETASKALRIEWVESDPVDVDNDPVVYDVWVTANSSDENPIWNLVASVSEGETRCLVDVSQYPDGTDYKVRMQALDSKGQAGDYRYSGKFIVVNSVAISDFERLEGSLYVGSNDGRIFRARETIWQVDEDWSGQREEPSFDLFVSGTPQAKIADGKLTISPVPGTTYLLRHSEK